MKQFISTRIIAGFSIILIAGVILRHRANTTTSAPFTIGIIQTASHPALDAVNQGFTSRLTQLIPGVAYVTQNAQGSTNAAHLIAQHCAQNQTIAATLAIATPAAQAAAHTHTTKPVVFAAVSDPAAAGLTAANLCGIADTVDPVHQCNLIMTLVPHARTVALLFNKGEVNATSMVAKFEQELSQRGLRVVHCCVTNESEIPHAVMHACNRADVILAPIDNTVASTIDCIAATALTHKIPLFVCDTLLVSRGAFAACGVDYHQSGAAAAELMHQILTGAATPASIGTRTTDATPVFVNTRTAQTLGIKIPADLAAVIVEGTHHAQ